MPQLDREQRQIVRIIKRESRTLPKKLRPIFRRAAVQTGLVESNLRELDYGDADSQNWRQERASIYGDEWARTGGANNTVASVRRFKQEFLQHYNPGEKSYEVAAQVQRPAAQYRDRYRQVAGQARDVLGQVGAGAGSVSRGSDGARAGTYTVPGVDNSGARQALLQQYVLSERGKPNALLSLKAGLDAARDVPGRVVKVPGGSRSGSPRSRKGGKAGETTITQILAEAAEFGLTVREHPKYDTVDPVHTEGSYHYRPAKRGRRTISRGAAGDITGPPERLAAFKRMIRRKYGRDLEELIYNAGGGPNLKDGRKVGPGFYSGHETHLHVADDD